MKEFDLEAALNGEPVKLACGKKAYVFYNLSRYSELSEYVNELPLNGIVMDEDNWDKKYHANWSLSGESIFDRDSIIGMWEEPKLTSEQVLEKAYQEDLKVSLDGQDVYIIIGKAKDGSYLLGSEQSDSYVAWCIDLGEPEICREDTEELSPKSDTITVTLPKPFKPKDGEIYYYIYLYKTNFYLDVFETTFSKCRYDEIMADSGNCFRTKEDAQKWLDFMKGMLE